jgi:hypothetical protein
MKKIYRLFILAICIVTNANAQLTLTKVTHAPNIGDSFVTYEYDSILPVARQAGQNQLWDFSGLTPASNPTTVVSFSLPSSIPTSTGYPGTTIVEVQPNSLFGYMKTYTNATGYFYEALGFSMPSFTASFTNGMQLLLFPFSLGSTFTDTYNGTLSTSIPSNAQTSGTITETATGTGTIILPGGTAYTNVLQVKGVKSDIDKWLQPTAYIDKNTSVSYNYYHSIQEPPLLTFIYVTDSLNNMMHYSISVYTSKPNTTGMKNADELSTKIQVYPNPACDLVTISSENSFQKISIMDISGQLVKEIEVNADFNLHETIDVSLLARGVYIVNLSLGDDSHMRRLVLR